MARVQSTSPFSRFLAENISSFQSLENATPPVKGRRAKKLALCKEFWALPLEERQRLSKVDDASDSVLKESISKALEAIDEEEDGNDTPLGVGIVVRTDYSDDDAWNRFCDALREAEKEGAEEEVDAAEDNDNSKDEEGDSADSESSSDDETPQSLFIYKSEPSLAGISNIAALRRFNDVDVAPSPRRPLDAPIPKSKVSHPLQDKDGLLEAYTGNLIWIYDSKSNADGTVRVVSQKGDTYGTVTGDSWRARAPFLPGLQVNLFGGGMKITFTGVDGWDQGARQRNLEEGKLA